jgi:hypothetical protein
MEFGHSNDGRMPAAPDAAAPMKFRMRPLDASDFDEPVGRESPFQPFRYH